MWDMTHLYVRLDSFIVWHDSFIYESQMWHEFLWNAMWNTHVCETWRIHKWGMTHSYVRHDSFMCETWLIHIRDITHSYESLRCDMIFCWNVTLSTHICVTRLSHMEMMSQIHSVWHDSFMCVTWLSLKCHMTHWYVWHASFTPTQPNSLLSVITCFPYTHLFHTHKHTITHTYIHTRTYTRTRTHTHTQMHMHTHPHAHIRTRARTRTRTRTRTRARARTHTHTRTRTQMHTHTHLHSQILAGADHLARLSSLLCTPRVSSLIRVSISCTRPR